MCRYLVFLVFLTLSFTLSAQRGRKKVFHTSAFAGFTAAQVQGDGLGGFDKPGLTAGFGVGNRINKKWGIGFELSFVQKGSRKVQDPDNEDYTYYRLSLNYAEVPLLVQYYRKKLTVFAGPTVGYLLGSHEEISGEILPIQNPFRKYEVGVTLGAAYRFARKWDISMRIQDSALSIRPTPAYAKGFLGRYSGQYNTVLNFVLVYQFSGDKK
ncbi:MAG: porin family protein [Bacteroidota bacterium]